MSSVSDGGVQYGAVRRRRLEQRPLERSTYNAFFFYRDQVLLRHAFDGSLKDTALAYLGPKDTSNANHAAALVAALVSASPRLRANRALTSVTYCSASNRGIK